MSEQYKIMKKTYFHILLNLLFINLIYSQVGINTTTPTNSLDVNGDVRIRTISDNDNETTVITADNDGVIGRRYVYGDNIQSVVLSGTNQNINSTSYVDITGATITFTPRHSVVYLSFAISGYNPLNCSEAYSQLSWFVVGVFVDGVQEGQFLSLSANQGTNGTSGAATIGASYFPINVTPDVPVTISLRGRDGGMNHTCGFNIPSNSYTSYMTIVD